jgi:hypothetical protein
MDMDELLSVFRPSAKVLQFFGFITFIVYPNGTVQMCRNKVLYSTAIIVTLNFLICLRIVHSDQYRMKGSFLSKISLNISILMTDFLYVLSVVVISVRRKDVEDYLRTLCCFDGKVI